MNFKDKVIVITGGTKGLGKSLADLFVHEGATVAVCSKNVPSIPVGTFHMIADVRKESDVDAFAGEVINKFGKIDIWVNNAGIMHPSLLSKVSLDMNKAHDIIDTNFFGTVFGCRAALAYMEGKGEGMIVNISSSAALDATRAKNANIYAASKWAIRGYIQTVKEEIADSNIKIISVYPGGTKTELYKDQKPANYNEYMDPNYVAQKIVDNLTKENPKEEQIIKRPTAEI